MRKILILAVLVVAGAFAQATLTIGGPAGNVKAGQTFNLVVSISGTTVAPIVPDQALQFTLAGMTWPIVPNTGAAATTAGKTLTCAQVGTAYNCVVAGLNTTSLVDGVLGTLTITLPKTTGSGTSSIGLTQVLAATPDSTGTAISAALTVAPPFILNTSSLCDLNSDGKVDITDFSLSLQQAIGVQACTTSDVNSDGKCNVLDIITIAAAAQNGTCAAK